MDNEDFSILGTWIGITTHSILVVTYRPDCTFSGSLQSPEFDYKALLNGNWKIENDTLYSTYTSSVGSKFTIPMEDRDIIHQKKKHSFILEAQDGRTVIFTRVHFQRIKPSAPPWRTTIAPLRLTTELFRNAKDFLELDEVLWAYLCDCIPDTETPYRERIIEMLNDLSPELRRYFLIRSFVWESCENGLDGFMMDDDDFYFSLETAKAFEELGAKCLAKSSGT